MSSYKKSSFMNIPPPEGGQSSIHSRFIPREELNGFKTWNPDSFGDNAESPLGTPSKTSPPPPPPPDPAKVMAEMMHATRQEGYQEGYRDGMNALESFKQTFADEMTAQIGDLLQAMGQQFDVLHREMAQALATTAIQIARQVVRNEIATQPDLITKVANEALDALVLSARHITLRVHPEDHALVVHGAADLLKARGARVIPDENMIRGGCVIESDIGSVDATVATRWTRAVAMLGQEVPWNADAIKEEPPTEEGELP